MLGPMRLHGILRRSTWLCLSLVPTLAGCSADEEEKSPAPVEAPRFITDDQGRVLILRGINTNNRAKSAPLRSPGLTDEDLDRIGKTWGFNVARYIILWDTLEPQPGQIDAEYLERIATDVDRLGRVGVRVVLDMHQDVYAMKFCCDGAPEWAIRDDGQPFELQDQWALNYYQPAVKRAFDNFWDATGPHADLQQHYAAVWQAIARRFAEHDNIVGYDVMNEPFPGSDFDVGEALFRRSPEDGGTTKVFDETKLGPFYQRMIDAIRKVDTRHWIFVEPRYGAPGNGSPSYLPVLRDPRQGEPRIVFAPHLYSVSAEATNNFNAKDPTVELWETERHKELERQQMPVWLGEWWAYRWEDPNAPAFVKRLLAMADRMQIGWAYWSYDPGGPGGAALHASDGSSNPAVATVVRPYPRAIAGEPLAFSFDPTSRVFELSFRQRKGVTGTTEIFVPAHTYPAGFDVSLPSDPGGSTTFDPETGLIQVTADAAVQEHRVRLTPKP